MPTSTSATTLTAVVRRAMPPGLRKMAARVTIDDECQRQTQLDVARHAHGRHELQHVAVGEPDDDHRGRDEGASADVAQQQPGHDGDGTSHGHGAQDGLEGLPEGDLRQVLREQEQDRIRRQQQRVEGNGLSGTAAVRVWQGLGRGSAFAPRSAAPGVVTPR